MYLKLAQKGKKLKEGLVVVTPGNLTQDLLHRKPCTNQLWLSFLQRGYILFLIDAAHVSPSSLYLTCTLQDVKPSVLKSGLAVKIKARDPQDT